MKALAGVLVLVFLVLAVLAIAYFVLALLSLVWIRFQSNTTSATKR
jgi:hypothetical protein